MRIRAIVAALAACAAPLAAAQTRDQPSLIFTIYAGTATGHELWQIARQPMPARDGNAPDTARLSRRVNSGLAAGLMATLFPSAHWGVKGEIAFRTFGFDDACAPVVPFQPDAILRNQGLCDHISASANTGSVLSFHVGGTARLAPRGAISPYARASVSLSHMAISTIAVTEAEPIDTLGNELERVFIRDDAPRQTALGLTLGGGFTFQVSPGYQFRLEVRDDIATLERLAGPASALAVAPTEVAVFHHLVLLFGIDIVLEQKRGRRY
jgi:opacity protein-like surface antigen